MDDAGLKRGQILLARCDLAGWVEHTPNNSNHPSIISMTLWKGEACLVVDCEYQRSPDHGHFFKLMLPDGRIAEFYLSRDNPRDEIFEVLE